ncbi:hypothetical protein [Streptomyces californicus]|uniref:hypothetical protein n=1 Tax=Streptomyces californicus TaxID=67351 RepID=UPI0033217A32
MAAMNAMPEYVASRTLRDPGWANTTVLGADLTAEVGRVKAASEEETVVLGSGGLLGTLREPARGLSRTSPRRDSPQTTWCSQRTGAPSPA